MLMVTTSRNSLSLQGMQPLNLKPFLRNSFPDRALEIPAYPSIQKDVSKISALNKKLTSKVGIIKTSQISSSPINTGLKSFDEILPNFKTTIDKADKKIAHTTSQKEIDEIKEKLRIELHDLIVIPKPNRSRFRLIYSDRIQPSKNLDALIHETFRNFFSEIKGTLHPKKAKKIIQKLKKYYSIKKIQNLTNSLKKTNIVLKYVNLFIRAYDTEQKLNFLKTPHKETVLYNKALVYLKSASSMLHTIANWPQAKPFLYGSLNSQIHSAIGRFFSAISKKTPEKNIADDVLLFQKYYYQTYDRNNSYHSAIRITEDLETAKKMFASINLFIGKLTTNEASDLYEARSCLSTIIEWLEADQNKRLELLGTPKAHEAQIEFFQSIVCFEMIPQQFLWVSNLPPRSYASHHINVFRSSYETQSELLHELGHKAEESVLQHSIAYRETRCTKETFEKDGEIYRQCDWPQKGGTFYTGKIYPTLNTEIISTAIERLYRNPRKFFEEDPDLMRYLINTLRGIAA